MLDLNAPIEPGRAAAGFQIGKTIHALQAELTDARTLTYYAGFNLVKAINENVGLLRVEGLGDGTCFHFGADTVRLIFSKTGVLGCIYVFSGYNGLYRSASIGSALSVVSRVQPLCYDDGDEMYYRVDQSGDYIAGLSIGAAEAIPGEHETTPIYGFCVHDWSLLNEAA